MDDATVLPYRTVPEELLRWVGARALGREPGTRGEPGWGAKSLEGAAATAVALDLASTEGVLTPTGRRLALADETERRALLRDAMLDYAPYGALLAEIRRRGDPATASDWMETWWATRGIGNSASNRQEGAATFGRLVEWTGLGRYVPGRRGHPTRVEWAAPGGPPSVTVEEPDDAGPVDEVRVGVEMNRLGVRLEDGTTARLEVPLKLPAAEKRRLLDLLDLLITEE